MSKILPDQHQHYIETSAELLVAMSNEVRLKILMILVDREISVGPLCELVGLSQSAVSQHLAKLRQHKLVKTRCDAQVVYYRCESSAVNKILTMLRGFFGPDS